MNYELAKKLRDAGFPQKDSSLEKSTIVSSCCEDAIFLEHNFKVKEGDARYFDACKRCGKKCGGRQIRPLYYPTLSELIEACGDKFCMVGNDRSHESYHVGGRNFVPKEQEDGKNMWRSYAYTGGKDFGTVDGYGDTPEEAVANLWLKLNEISNTQKT